MTDKLCIVCAIYYSFKHRYKNWRINYMYIVISACILKTKMAVRIIKLVSQTRVEFTTENKPKFFPQSLVWKPWRSAFKGYYLGVGNNSANLIQIRKTESSVLRIVSVKALLCLNLEDSSIQFWALLIFSKCPEIRLSTSNAATGNLVPGPKIAEAPFLNKNS